MSDSYRLKPHGGPPRALSRGVGNDLSTQPTPLDAHVPPLHTLPPPPWEQGGRCVKKRDPPLFTKGGEGRVRRSASDPPVPPPTPTGAALPDHLATPLPHPGTLVGRRVPPHSSTASRCGEGGSYHTDDVRGDDHNAASSAPPSSCGWDRRRGLFPDPAPLPPSAR